MPGDGLDPTLVRVREFRRRVHDRADGTQVCEYEAILELPSTRFGSLKVESIAITASEAPADLSESQAVRSLLAAVQPSIAEALRTSGG